MFHSIPNDQLIYDQQGPRCAGVAHGCALGRRNAALNAPWTPTPLTVRRRCSIAPPACTKLKGRAKVGARVTQDASAHRDEPDGQVSSLSREELVGLLGDLS